MVPAWYICEVLWQCELVQHGGDLAAAEQEAERVSPIAVEAEQSRSQEESKS